MRKRQHKGWLTVPEMLRQSYPLTTRWPEAARRRVLSLALKVGTGFGR